MPLPDTVRDAVLIGASELTAEGRAAADVAAVAGEAFAPELVAALSSDAGLTELLERGLVLESAGRRRLLPPRARPGGALRRRAVDPQAHAAPRARRGARARGRPRR